MGTSPEPRRSPDPASDAAWQHAVQVGDALDLGEPLGIFHTGTTPPMGVRLVARLIAPAVVYVLAAILLMVSAPDLATPLIGAAPCLVIPYGFVCYLVTRRRRFIRRLYGYTGGLAELDPGEPPRVVRWDDVTDAVDEWSSAGSESGLWSYQGFRLTTADGRTLPIAAGYRNSLDPYGPGADVVAALIPGGAALPRPRPTSIADLITGRALARVVAHQAAVIHGGGVVVRGDIRVTRDGIAGPKDATVTPWAAIDRIELRPGRVTVRPVTGRPRKYADHRDGSGYAVLARLLLALGVNASFEASG